MGFVAGYLPLPDRLKVREALSIFAGFYGLGRKAGEDAVDRGLERFKIPHLADRMCMELSSGQRTLVGIVKAILHDPDLLVLDEPTASLDPDVAYRVRTGLLDVAATDGTALLVTSHNMREVERLCERVVFLAAGKVVADGSPDEVADAFGHGDLEGVFLHLAGTVVSEDEIPDLVQRSTTQARRLHATALDEPSDPTDRPFSWLRVRTVVRRHGYVLFRSPHRWFDIAFWPVFDVILLGSLATFVAQQDETSQAGVPYLLAGIMLFHVLFQSQIAVATGFMEETWTRNILNVMTTPLREVEYVLGLALMGLLKLVAAMVTVSITALVFYRFGLGEVGWGIVPVIGVLLLCGWCTAMLVIGLLLRYGQSAEILAWATTFVLLALSGVFNPVESLPGPLQPIAQDPPHHLRLPRRPRPARRRPDPVGRPPAGHARRLRPRGPVDALRACGCCAPSAIAATSRGIPNGCPGIARQHLRPSDAGRATSSSPSAARRAHGAAPARGRC